MILTILSLLFISGLLSGVLIALPLMDKQQYKQLFVSMLVVMSAAAILYIIVLLF